MPAILKDLKITSVDLVDAGANPDARIQLFKRKENVEPGDDTLLQKILAAITGVFGKAAEEPTDVTVEKEAGTFNEQIERERTREICNEIWNFAYMFQDSLCSILNDDNLSEDGRHNMMFESLDQYTAAMRDAIPMWAAMKRHDENEAVEKSTAQEAAFAELIGKYIKSPGSNSAEPADTVNINKSQKEVINTMNIDKSKLTPEELAALEAIEKKYGTSEPGVPPAEGDDVTKGADTQTPLETQTPPPPAPAPELHPEVKKALEANQTLTAQVEELKKSLEIKDLAAIAKKYEVIGKKSEELAPNLYDLKKAGGTVYDEFVALLDEQVTLVEKSGLFGEIGTARAGATGNAGELDAKAAEIRKNNSGMSDAEALAKAFEENPDLAAKYEQEYMSGRFQ